MDRAKVFISYSHKDDRWRERLVGHLGVLQREGLLELWDDRRLRAGNDFLSQIHQNMLSARVAVLLISADFLTSDFIRTQEVPRLFDRHVEGGMTIYPLLVRDCAWQEVSWLARMELRPRDAKPVNRRGKADEILANVAREIASIIREGSLPSADRPTSEATHADGSSQIQDPDDRVLSVRVHRAVFVGSRVDCSFVNVTNLSRARPLEVTHVWYQHGAIHVPIFQRSRPLPVRLELDQSWETWIDVSALPSVQSDVFGSFRVRISTGTVFSSVANLDVPPVGTVPGGPVE